MVKINILISELNVSNITKLSLEILLGYNILIGAKQIAGSNFVSKKISDVSFEFSFYWAIEITANLPCII